MIGIKAIAAKSGREYYYAKYTKFKMDYLNPIFENTDKPSHLGADHRIVRTLRKHPSVANQKMSPTNEVENEMNDDDWKIDLDDTPEVAQTMPARGEPANRLRRNLFSVTRAIMDRREDSALARASGGLGMYGSSHKILRKG